MKATIRIPTVQYGYIELEFEDVKDIDAIIGIHNEAIGLFKASLPKADTNNNDDF